MLEEDIAEFKQLILEHKRLLEADKGLSADDVALRIFELAKKIKGYGVKGRRVLASLMDEDNPHLRNSGAVHSIVMPEYLEKALKVLNKNKTIPGYAGMDANLHLAAWKNRRDLFS